MIINTATKKERNIRSNYLIFDYRKESKYLSDKFLRSGKKKIKKQFKMNNKIREFFMFLYFYVFELFASSNYRSNYTIRCQTKPFMARNQ